MTDSEGSQDQPPVSAEVQTNTRESSDFFSNPEKAIGRNFVLWKVKPKHKDQIMQLLSSRERLIVVQEIPVIVVKAEIKDEWDEGVMRDVPIVYLTSEDEKGKVYIRETWPSQFGKLEDWTSEEDFQKRETMYKKEEKNGYTEGHYEIPPGSDESIWWKIVDSAQAAKDRGAYYTKDGKRAVAPDVK